MSEQLCGHVRRAAERNAREERGAPGPPARHPRCVGLPPSHQVECQRIRAARVEEHRRDDVEIPGRDYRQAAECGGREVALQCGMRMVDEVDTERTEQMPRLKKLELWCTQRLSHPPQIPEKAVVVAAGARNVIAEMEDEGPGPDDGQGGEEAERRRMREQATALPLTTLPPTPYPSPLKSHAPASSPR